MHLSSTCSDGTNAGSRTMSSPWPFSSRDTVSSSVKYDRRSSTASDKRLRCVCAVIVVNMGQYGGRREEERRFGAHLLVEKLLAGILQRARAVSNVALVRVQLVKQAQHMRNCEGS